MVIRKITLLKWLFLKDDDYLEINGFRRDEVENGVRHLLSEYGLETMADIFLH